jgi:predicted enzyme related to lactoylglutathione lyase
MPTYLCDGTLVVRNGKEGVVGSRFETHGDFSWTELMTRDVEAAKKFYGELLGWTMEDMSMGEGTYTVLKAGGASVGGIMTMPAQVPSHVPAHWAAYVTVDDVDAVAKKAEELGAKTIVPPTDIPGVGRFYTFRDPEGTVLSVISYSREHQEQT